MTIVLHQYPTSPFSELVRLALGLKGLDYKSVMIPVIMPKPDLVALTGGYARTPVLQVGADIYCDTAAMLGAIEALQPEPSLYPAPLGILHWMLANWAGGPQFYAHVGAALGGLPAGALPQAFIADRQTRFGLDMAQLAQATPHLVSQALVAATWLEELLGDGRAFVGGDAAGHADLAFYSNVWFVRAQPMAGPAAAAMAAMPGLAAWSDRVAAIGHGHPTGIDGAAAIAIAAAAEPDLGEAVDADSGFSAGQAVLVKSEGSGDAPVPGRLIRLSSHGIALARDEAGVVVNFPRLGQIVMPA